MLRLAGEIADGTLEGMDWWNAVHASDGDVEPVWNPLPIGDGSRHDMGGRDAAAPDGGER